MHNFLLKIILELYHNEFYSQKIMTGMGHQHVVPTLLGCFMEYHLYVCFLFLTYHADAVVGHILISFKIFKVGS